MAEAILGTVGSVITIGDLVIKIKHFGSKVRTAPDDWKRYYDELEALNHIRLVLTDIIQKSSNVAELPIEVDGKRENLVEFINNRLQLVREEALAILNTYDQLKRKKSNRLWDFVSKFRESCSFVLEDGHIQGLIQAVEYAKSCLQSAICLALLSSSDSQYQKNYLILNEIKERMSKQSEALHELNETSRLNRRPIEIDCPPWLRLLQEKLISSPEYSKKSYPEASFTEKLKIMSESTKRASRSAEALVHMSGDENHAKLKNHTSRYQNDVLSDSPGCEQPRGRSTDKLPQANDIPGGDIIRRGDKLIFVHDGPNKENFAIDPSNVSSQTGSDAVAEVDYSESVARNEQVTSARVYPKISSDIGSKNNSPPQADIELKQSSHGFISQTVDLTTCYSLETGNNFFCIESFVATGENQIFYLTEPCSSQDDCKHITIESISGQPVRTQSFFHISMLLLSYDCCFNNSTPRISSMPHRCNSPEKCGHTAIQNGDCSQVKCALPVRLCAILDGTIKQLEPALPLAPSADEDQFTFNILKNVMESSRIPESLRLNHLFDFLLLVQKYDLGNAPLEQAKKWAQILRLRFPDHLVEATSGSLTEPAEKTFTKLVKLCGIFWKLGMTREFRESSIMIQKHAQLPIDKLVKPSIILLPQDVIEKIDENRTTALSIIKKFLKSQIMSHEASYARVLADHQRNLEIAAQTGDIASLQVSQSGILKISLAFGYLTLERKRWFKTNRGDTDVAAFDGVSIFDTCNSVRAMVDLSGWMISDVPLSEVIPRGIANAVRMVPIIGANLHSGRCRAILSSDDKIKLEELTERLEREGWGTVISRI